MLYANMFYFFEGIEARLTGQPSDQLRNTLNFYLIVPGGVDRLNFAELTGIRQTAKSLQGCRLFAQAIQQLRGYDRGIIIPLEGNEYPITSALADLLPHIGPDRKEKGTVAHRHKPIVLQLMRINSPFYLYPPKRRLFVGRDLWHPGERPASLTGEFFEQTFLFDLFRTHTIDKVLK